MGPLAALCLAGCFTAEPPSTYRCGGNYTGCQAGYRCDHDRQLCVEDTDAGRDAAPDVARDLWKSEGPIEADGKFKPDLPAKPDTLQADKNPGDGPAKPDAPKPDLPPAKPDKGAADQPVAKPDQPLAKPDLPAPPPDGPVTPPDAAPSPDLVPADMGPQPDKGPVVNPPKTGACKDDGWCWVNPYPHGESLNAIWGRSASEVWAINATGAHRGQGGHGSELHLRLQLCADTLHLLGWCL